MPGPTPATIEDKARVDMAIGLLRQARDLLRAAGCHRRTINRVRDAISSAKGARRHVRVRVANTVPCRHCGAAYSDADTRDPGTTVHDWQKWQCPSCGGYNDRLSTT